MIAVFIYKIDISLAPSLSLSLAFFVSFHFLFSHLNAIEFCDVRRTAFDAGWLYRLAASADARIAVEAKEMQNKNNLVSVFPVHKSCAVGKKAVNDDETRSNKTSEQKNARKRRFLHVQALIYFFFHFGGAPSVREFFPGAWIILSHFFFFAFRICPRQPTERSGCDGGV